MITNTIHNLRTPDWTQVDRRWLRDYMHESRCEADTVWTITPWTRRDGYRSYLIHSTDGALFAVFFKRK